MVDIWRIYGWPTALMLAEILAIIVPLLVAVAYLTLAERKVIAAVHLRKGPNVVGPFGLFQPLADGLKAEVDFYRGDLDGLCTVEVEFPSAAAAAAFAPPDWFGTDVTSDKRFKNQNLALQGRPK